METALWLIGAYLVLGIAAAFFLKQTPYAENPLWVMVLFWPLYVFTIFFR